MCKVVSKILATRFSRVIGKIVSDNQITFIPGRQILEGVLVTNELIDFASREKRNCMMFKDDFTQAYECVNWKYLRDIMKKMEFGQRWLSWIDAGIFSTRMSVFVTR